MTAHDHVLAALIALFSPALVFLRPPRDAGVARGDLYASGTVTRALASRR